MSDFGATGCETGAKCPKGWVLATERDLEPAEHGTHSLAVPISVP